jgi:hypothetical protein
MGLIVLSAETCHNHRGQKGVVQNLDPEIKAPATQAENLMAWEVYRVFYHLISKSLSSPDWPTPDVDPTSLAGCLGPLVLQGAQTVLTGTDPWPRSCSSWSRPSQSRRRLPWQSRAPGNCSD